MNGQAFAFHYALPVDSAGELPDGRAFEDVREFKTLAAERRGGRSRATSRGSWRSYATGAPVRFSDRAEIERIVAAHEPRASTACAPSCMEIVQSELFLNK